MFIKLKNISKNQVKVQLPKGRTQYLKPGEEIVRLEIADKDFAYYKALIVAGVTCFKLPVKRVKTEEPTTTPTRAQRESYLNSINKTKVIEICKQQGISTDGSKRELIDNILVKEYGR